MTRLNTMHSNPASCSGEPEKGRMFRWIYKRRVVVHYISIQKFKVLLEQKLKKNCERSLYTLKFQMEDHVLENSERFGSVYGLDASPFQHVDVYMKRAYRAT